MTAQGLVALFRQCSSYYFPYVHFTLAVLSVARATFAKHTHSPSLKHFTLNFQGGLTYPDFLLVAPVSVFDERLEEDPRVNRLEDSVVLWSCICETPLLANTQLILFLNKCDLLQRKLNRGVKVVDYLSSYGKRSNDPKSVIKCAWF